MIWVILVLLSIFTNATTRILQKKMMSHEASDPVVFSFIFQIITAIIILGWGLFIGFRLPALTIDIIIGLAIVTALYAGGNIFTFKAFKTTPASDVTLILASSAIWTVFSAIILKSETLTMIKIIGITLIFLSIVIVQYKPSKNQLQIGHLHSLIASIMFGIAFVIDTIYLEYFNNVYSYLFWAFLLPGLALIFVDRNVFKKSVSILNRSTLARSFVVSFLYALTAIFLYSAYAHGGSASIISPLFQTNVLVTILFSYFILKENQNPIRKLLATIIIILGATLTII